MTNPTNSEVYALLRLSFVAFVEKVFRTLLNGREMQDNWHIQAICHALGQVQKGTEKRVMINIPPRSLKSIIVSVAWPAFLLGHNPGLQIFVVSHNLDLAIGLSNKFRQIVNADWYKAAFPTMSGAPQKDNERIFLTDAGGFREAISVNGAVIGKGADICIMDDLLDASEVATENGCAKVNNWIDTSLSTRLNDPASSAMVLVMQRLAINDPAAHLQTQEDWNCVTLPAIAEEDQIVPISDVEEYHFNKGELLDAARLPMDTLDVQRAKLGTANFLAQYQQRPVPPGGGEIDISLFQRYKTLPKLYDVRFLSVDAASSCRSGSYSVIQVWQMTNGNVYLADNQRGYWTFPQLTKRVVDTQTLWKANFVAIERASSGLALIDVLWEHYPDNIRRTLVQGLKHKGLSKEDRAGKAMVLVEQGLVHIPLETLWLNDLLAEFSAFPAGSKDDQVDAFSHAIEFFRKLLVSRFNPEYRGRGRVLK
ncbi:phage terminase large subunit [Ruegeria sp. HKCCD7303]|uniref:phage terminase large subunit n=1 Tax=Ruegeria sp. HKCCD7303 TaxID=2683013 RepID=UPI00147BB45F|nr:phage terminase large subunit [Ruegeria sp. HKCCD7303]NOD68270.1 phage terminase large subunit [Ruegeria sp. HKCCD7303]